MVDKRQIALVRRFNRVVTQTVGALQERYLGLDRPLAEARLLYEIGPSGADLKDLRARLGLDSGYLSRLLRALEAEGLVTTPSSDEDKRRRRTGLTRTGRRELRKLDRRSDALADSLIEPLNDAQRKSLVAAVTTVERLLSVSQVTIAEEPPDSDEARYCLREYFRELQDRFEGGFDPNRSLSPTLEEFVPPAGRFFIARRGGLPIGCGGYKRLSRDAVYLKRMWIAPDQRGLGLGRRLLQTLEDSARTAGYRVARLETNQRLVEAQQLYRKAGYRAIAPFNDEPYAHHWYEKRLT